MRGNSAEAITVNAVPTVSLLKIKVKDRGRV